MQKNIYKLSVVLLGSLTLYSGLVFSAKSAEDYLLNGNIAELQGTYLHSLSLMNDVTKQQVEIPITSALLGGTNSIQKMFNGGSPVTFSLNSYWNGQNNNNLLLYVQINIDQAIESSSLGVAIAPNTRYELLYNGHSTGYFISSSVTTSFGIKPTRQGYPVVSKDITKNGAAIIPNLTNYFDSFKEISVSIAASNHPKKSWRFSNSQLWHFNSWLFGQNKPFTINASKGLWQNNTAGYWNLIATLVPNSQFVLIQNYPLSTFITGGSVDITINGVLVAQLSNVFPSATTATVPACILQP